MAYGLNITWIIAQRPLITILFCGFLAGGMPGQAGAQDTPAEKDAAGLEVSHETFGLQDDFSEWQSLPADEMSRYSGGTGTTFGDVGLNLATNNSSLIGNSVEGTVETGQIQDLSLNDVGGINTLMFNTGNNVNFQSNMQINIFVK